MNDHLNNNNILEIPVIRGIVLGVKVYRGFSKLCDLANISKADIYDQINNPKGTQRDLNIAHAREAYGYVRNKDFAYWPEVFLCARNKEVITYIPLSDDNPEIGTLLINRSMVNNQSEIAISRVDGNHRLYYAGGIDDKFQPIEKQVSFCLAYELSQEEEIQLFKDINDNQKAMNTSHLDNIEVRLTPQEQLKRRNPELFIAQKLGQDRASPLYNRVFEGGKRSIGLDIPLRTIKTGVEYMLSRSTQLPRLEDAEAQFRVIRNYFASVKEWNPKSWETPKEYIILRGVGLWAICFIGAHVIDRVLIQDKFDTNDMLAILNSGKEWDWSRNGHFKGFSGRAGALEICKMVTRKFHDESKMSSKELFKKIMGEK